MYFGLYQSSRLKYRVPYQSVIFTFFALFLALLVEEKIFSPEIYVDFFSRSTIGIHGRDRVLWGLFFVKFIGKHINLRST